MHPWPASLPVLMKDIMTSCLDHHAPGQLIRFYNKSHIDSALVSSETDTHEDNVTGRNQKCSSLLLSHIIWVFAAMFAGLL